MSGSPDKPGFRPSFMTGWLADGLFWSVVGRTERVAMFSIVGLAVELAEFEAIGGHFYAIASVRLRIRARL